MTNQQPNNDIILASSSLDSEIPINEDVNERIARALQLQFDLEDDLQASSNNPNANTRPTSSNTVSAGQQQQQQQAIDNAVKLQFQLEEDIRQTSLNDLNRPQPQTNTQDDVEFAKKLEQELRDEELAMRLQEEETQPSLSSVSSAEFEVAHNIAQRQRRRQCTYRTLGYIVTVPLLIAAVFSIMYMFFGPSGTKNPIFPGFPIFPDVVLYGDGDNATLVPWASTRGRGLDMTLINALTSNWHKHFDEAVKSWDNGDPDSLNLKTVVTTPDPICSPVQGMIKVCNGNYGNTEWKGINEIMVKRNQIVTSVAKMNDYYSKLYSDGEREYLMCHEIGHGFGLPHADENFNNRDLGTCMDYTMRPESNMKPNARDYDLLLQMYGPVDVKRPSNLRSLSLNMTQEMIEERHLSFLDTFDTHPWNMVFGNDYIQEYELELGEDVKMRSHLLLR